MAFVRTEGFKGLVYVPEKLPRLQKHCCTDCFECAFCSNERCKLCLNRKSRTEDDNSEAKSS